MLNLLGFAFALAAAPIGEVTDQPVMRVQVGDLELSRAADVRTLAGRLLEASDAYCARHARIVTPNHVGDLTLCRRGMMELAIDRLPAPDQRAFERGGGMRMIELK